MDLLGNGPGRVYTLRDADMRELSSSTRMLLVQLKSSLHADGLRLGFDNAQITISDLRNPDDPPHVQLQTKVSDNARLRIVRIDEGEFSD